MSLRSHQSVFVWVCSDYKTVHAGGHVHNCTNTPSHIQTHLKSYLCTQKMWPCVGWLVRARSHRHLKTTSPHWQLIFMLFSQKMLKPEIVWEALCLTPPLPCSQSSYLSIWLCIQSGFIPPGENRVGRWQVKSGLSRSVRMSLRLFRQQRWVDLVFAYWREDRAGRIGVD